MRILVLHHHRFSALRYDQAFDHARHDVTYVGTANFLGNIPAGVRCAKFEVDAFDTVVDEVREWAVSQPSFDRIIARHESMILPAAQLRDTLGVSGMTAAVALRFRDKMVMKQAIAAAGLRTPRCVGVADLVAGPSVRPAWTGKTVLKPRDGAGSEGVEVFDACADAVDAAFARANADPKFAREYELEEFVTGDIWHVDGYLRDGEPVLIQPSRYVNTCLEFNRGRPFGSAQMHNDTLTKWTLRCLDALGADTLSFHLEAFDTADGPVFLEVAARCGGAYIVDAIEGRYGAFPHALDMASEIEGRICERFRPRPPDDRAFGGFIFPGHVYGGRPCRVEIDRARLEGPPIVSCSILPENVDTVLEPTYRMDLSPLSGVVASSDPLVLERWIRDLFEDVRVHS